MKRRTGRPVSARSRRPGLGLGLLPLALALGGCVVPSEKTACISREGCEVGETCVDGRCVATEFDVSGSGDGLASDAEPPADGAPPKDAHADREQLDSERPDTATPDAASSDATPADLRHRGDEGLFPSPRCGNERLDPGEACEPRLLEPLPCVEVDPQYASGTVGCRNDCTLDVDDCVAAGQCGNGVLEPGEVCDDHNTDDGDGCSANCFDEGEPSDATEAWCGTAERGFLGQSVDDPDPFCDASENRDSFIPGRPIRIRVKVHVVRSRGGRLAASLDAVENMVRGSQAYFGSARLELVWGGRDDVDVIPDDQNRFYNLRSAQFRALIATNNREDAFDAYIVHTYGGYCGRAADIGPGAGDAFAMKASCAAGTFAHELGHVLGLWHTHHRSNGPNCDQADDYCCDTPPDPGPPWARNEGTGLCNNPEPPRCIANCSDGSRPDTLNVMSYYTCADDPVVGHFTRHQAGRMRCHVERAFGYTQLPCDAGVEPCGRHLVQSSLTVAPGTLVGTELEIVGGKFGTPGGGLRALTGHRHQVTEAFFSDSTVP